MQEEKFIISPVILETDIDGKTEILPNIYIDKLSNKEKEKYFNILPDDFGIGNLYVTTNDPVAPNVFDYTFRLGLEYKLIYNEEDFDYMQNSLRLLKTSNFGIKYQRGVKYKDFSIVPNCSYLPELALLYSDIQNLNELYRLLKEQQDNILLQRIFEKLNLILSESEMTSDGKFKELITILNMIFIPQDDKYQATKKFSSRISTIFEIYYKQNYEKNYEKLNYYYDIRSKIEHAGSSGLNFQEEDKLKLVDLLDITRKSILLYLKQPIIFTKNNLCKIPLKKD